MKNISIIARYTFKEFIKGKIAIAVLSLCGILFFTTYVASELTYSTVNRIILDIGFGLVVLSSMSMAIFLGVNLISNELESKTLYMVLSRPVSRFEFFTGKITGLALIMILSIVILSLQTIVLYLFNGGQFVPLLGYVVFFSIIEALIVMVMTILFSLFTNRYLTIFYAVILYIVGHSLDGALQTKLAEKIPVLKSLINIIGYIIPSFYKLNFKDFVLYQATLENTVVYSALMYGVSYLVAIFFICLYVFDRKELT
ncbi:MAG: ABC transporter permease [Halobacteriovoraceae bacterium]|nr:ABC transporter permease [Halobacteriovoraceae bacterium]